jgi:NAD+ diphosphatase
LVALDDVEGISGLAARSLRDLYSRLGPPELNMVARAAQLLEWRRAHLYCGRCGASTVPPGDEVIARLGDDAGNARVCSGCGQIFFPRITPAVIMAVTRGDRLLLARNRDWPEGRFSVLAGFVGPAETLEEAVAREVHEEVGIVVSDVRYFGSQAWPFPSQMMIAFTAVHSEGEIAVDDGEIAEAGWYTPHEVAEKGIGLPPPFAISRRLIDDAFSRGGTRTAND